MALPDKNTLKEKLETIEIHNLSYPEPLDRIVTPGNNGEDYIEREERDFGTWIQDALKWDNEPRKAVFIEDYWDLDPQIHGELVSEVNNGIDRPGLEGGNLAGSAIEAMEEMSESSFSTVIGFQLNGLKDNQNPNQVMAPQGPDNLVETPDWYPDDDWFIELEEDEYVGVITDDKTAYARHIADNIWKRSGKYSIDDRFWKGYEEAIENYTGL